MIKKIVISTLLSSAIAFAAQGDIHTAKVIESQFAGIYTYIKVDENNKQYWIAVTKTDVKVGDSIKFKEQIVMKNFKSTALKKTFDEVMFADLANKEGVYGADNIHGIHGNMIKKRLQTAPKPDVKFNDGLVTSDEKAIAVTKISELYANKDKYKNKNVTIQGRALEVSNKVMGNTWIKIYDGSDSVIFRSPNEDEKIAVGSKVEATATINTDVDFGHGFKYQVLGVNATFKILNKEEAK